MDATRTLTLSEFLLARIAEDEDVLTDVALDVYHGNPISTGDDPWPSEQAFAERITPARIVAECSAKRAIVELVASWKHTVVDDCWYTCPAATEERDGGETCNDAERHRGCDCGRDKRVNSVLQPLAAVYADHADYNPDWA